MKDGKIGGICGYSCLGGLVSQCYNEGNLTIKNTETWTAVGGISGSISDEGTRIEQCYNTGNIEVTSVVENVRACGISDLSHSQGCGIDSCYNTGVIKLMVSGEGGDYPVATGIAGQMRPSGVYIRNCYNIGKCSVIMDGNEISAKRVASILGYTDYERCFKLLLANRNSGERNWRNSWCNR